MVERVAGIVISWLDFAKYSAYYSSADLIELGDHWCLLGRQLHRVLGAARIPLPEAVFINILWSSFINVVIDFSFDELVSYTAKDKSAYLDLEQILVLLGDALFGK